MTAWLGGIQPCACMTVVCPPAAQSAAPGARRTTACTNAAPILPTLCGAPHPMQTSQCRLSSTQKIRAGAQPAGHAAPAGCGGRGSARSCAPPQATTGHEQWQHGERMSGKSNLSKLDQRFMCRNNLVAEAKGWVSGWVGGRAGGRVGTRTRKHQAGQLQADRTIRGDAWVASGNRRRPNEPLLAVVQCTCAAQRTAGPAAVPGAAEVGAPGLPWHGLVQGGHSGRVGASRAMWRTRVGGFGGGQQWVAPRTGAVAGNQQPLQKMSRCRTAHALRALPLGRLGAIAPLPIDGGG